MVPFCGTVILADCDTFDGADAIRHGEVSLGIPLYVATIDVAEAFVQASGGCHDPVPSKSFSSSGTFAPVSATALLKFHVRSLPLFTTLTTVIGGKAPAARLDATTAGFVELIKVDRLAHAPIRRVERDGDGNETEAQEPSPNRTGSHDEPSGAMVAPAYSIRGRLELARRGP
jgi:hypothetical protein